MSKSLLFLVALFASATSQAGTAASAIGDFRGERELREARLTAAKIGVDHLSASDVGKLTAIQKDLQREARGFEAIDRARAASGIQR